MPKRAGRGCTADTTVAEISAVGLGNLEEATPAVRQKELLVCLKAERRVQKYF